MYYTLGKARVTNWGCFGLLQIRASVVTNWGSYYKLGHINNQSKISAPTCNGEFELPDGSYSISDIQDYFECILKTLGKDS